MWFEDDEFYLGSQKVKGDFILSVNLKFIGEGEKPHRKMGLIIWNSDTVYFDCAVHGYGLFPLQYLDKNGAITLEKKSEIVVPEFVKVKRKGNAQ